MLKKFVSIFTSKKEDTNLQVEQEKSIVDKVQKESIAINKKPKICCIDIDENVIESLKESGFNIAASGTLGSKVMVPNKNIDDTIRVLPNFDFPSNLHEFDITIIDLNNVKTIEYKRDEHKRTHHTGMSGITLLSIYPETIFDPRPYGSRVLNDKFNDLADKKHLVINFTTANYDVSYQPIKLEENIYNVSTVFTHNIFDFDKSISLSNQKTGHEVNVCVENEQLNNFLNKYVNEMSYNQTLYHPTNYDNGNYTPMSGYIPLIKNSSNDIVSMLIFDGNKIIFHFPQVKDKGKFLNEFLTQVAPSLFTELFPYSTAFKWKEDKNYWLPNHKNLLEEKELLETEHKKKIIAKALEEVRELLKDVADNSHIIASVEAKLA